MACLQEHSQMTKDLIKKNF